MRWLCIALMIAMWAVGGCAAGGRAPSNSASKSPASASRELPSAQVTTGPEARHVPATQATREEEDPFDHPVLHRPVEGIDRALLISVDGLRPDMLLRSDTPNLHRLFINGTFTFWARTIPHAITLPSHTSMVTGVIPRRHEIEWNTDLPLSRPVYPKFPTVMESLHRAGYSTAMCAGKSKFEILARPGPLDWSFVPKTEKVEDSEVASHAVRIIREHQPQFLFVHLPGVDNVGHAKGWGSHEQREAVATADNAVGQILAALDDAKVSSSTFILVTADHGGAGRTHLPDDARARHIPWIAFGPGIRKDLDLTTYPKLVIDTEDTCATIRYVMGLPEDSLLDGKPIKEIVQPRRRQFVAMRHHRLGQRVPA